MKKGAGASNKQGFKHQAFQNRIKRMMQSDEDVGKVTTGSTYIIANALEKFLDTLVSGSLEIAENEGARALTSSHLKSCIERNELLDFCKAITKNIQDLPSDERKRPREDTKQNEQRVRPRKTTGQRKPRDIPQQDEHALAENMNLAAIDAAEQGAGLEAEVEDYD